MHTLSECETEAIGGGMGLTLPSVQVSPNIIINTNPQINAGASIALLGGMASLDQDNDSKLWNSLIARLINF